MDCRNQGLGLSGRPYCFISDPGGEDGIVYDEANKADYPTEHVYAREVPKSEAATASIDSLILTAVRHKKSKGSIASWASRWQFF